MFIELIIARQALTMATDPGLNPSTQAVGALEQFLGVLERGEFPEMPNRADVISACRTTLALSRDSYRSQPPPSGFANAAAAVGTRGKFHIA